MRGIWLSALFLVMALGAIAENGYKAKVDLNNVQDDYLYVELWVPTVEVDEIAYHMPKVVPGTYSISDFGRFLSDFKAFGENGEVLEVESISANSWKIKGAKKLRKVSYWVEDSFDSEQDNVIFEPAGTNIEEGENFILNTFGFFGYLEGMKNRPYELQIKHPDNFFGASSLPKVASKGNMDTYQIDSYVNLADCPIMYCEPDTVTIKVANSDVLISVYSPNDVMHATDVEGLIEPILMAAKTYLGGKLPVDRYAFLIYLMDEGSKSGGMGALEHMTSSVYTLPELETDMIGQTIKDVSAHEFFHIVTPLNIHSEEIGDFDFVDPEMSAHLWMYEGVTEYTAHHVQVCNDLIDAETFLSIMQDKMRAAEQYKQDLPFTDLSTGCLDKHEDQYGNVYQKGALIGMCMDLKLRDLSDGKYGLPTLMADLSKKYGQKVSFKDEKLFQEIIGLTYPEIGTFLETHVAGGESLPLAEYLALAGVDYQAEFKEKQITLGGVRLGFDPDAQKLLIAEASEMNAFGKDLGFQEGDRLVSLNGKALELSSVQEVMEDFLTNTEERDKVQFVVERKDKKGNWKQKKLKAKALKVERTEQHAVSMMETPSERQQMIFKAWLGK